MNILSIGGSDPSSGAGIQSDIKTFESLGVNGFSVITTITSQNSKKFSGAEAISPYMVKQQIESIFSDFKIDAIKISMVYDSATIKVIYSKLHKSNIPIIVDPVIKSTTGGMLIEKNALPNYKKFIIPLSYIITPNVSEAEILSGIKIKTKNDLKRCALKIKSMGAINVIITGIGLKKGKISDFVLENSKSYVNDGKKLSIINHGSGCNYSSALASYMSMKKSIKESTKLAKEFTYNSIKNAKKTGKGIAITITSDKLRIELGNSIRDFTNLNKIYQAIPECQTNFVFSKPNAKSTNDILGVLGRIVKAGKSVVVTGDLEYGGSKHVASAVLATSKKFPSIRSAINIKFDQKIIQKCKKKGFVVLSYDRIKEPAKIKSKENSSILWGIKDAIKNSKRIPDVIFHRGDFGKEPMILFFGKTPQDVIKKISVILKS